MSRPVSISTLAILFFFTFFAIFASAAPTNATCGGLETESTPGQDVPDSTNTPNSTVVDDGTGDDSDVVDPNGVNTLAATRSGTATWFNVGLGACGYKNKDSDFIVALAQPDWNAKSHCNQKLQITNPANKRTKTATVRDLCPGCPSGNLDLSPSLFVALADDLNKGVFKMNWKYV